MIKEKKKGREREALDDVHQTLAFCQSHFRLLKEGKKVVKAALSFEMTLPLVGTLASMSLNALNFKACQTFTINVLHSRLQKKHKAEKNP